MVGEANGVKAHVNNERIQRENQVGPKSKVPEADGEQLAAHSSDVTTFTPEALALARNVAPVSGTAEQSQLEQRNTGQEKGRNSTARLVDIQA